MDHQGRLSVSPDGRHLYFSAFKEPETAVLNSDIYRLELATLKLEEVVAQAGPDAHARLSPDGKTLAFTGFQDQLRQYEVSRLHLLNLKNNTITTLTDTLDRDINQYFWRADGKGLYLSFDDRGESVMAWQPLKGQRIILPRKLDGTLLGRPYPSGDFAVQGDLLAFTHNSTQRPAEIAVMDSRKAKTRVMTSRNASLNAYTDFATIEELNYASSLDKLPLQAWIANLPGFDPSKKYPLRLEIHGGPMAN